MELGNEKKITSSQTHNLSVSHRRSEWSEDGRETGEADDIRKM